MSEEAKSAKQYTARHADGTWLPIKIEADEVSFADNDTYVVFGLRGVIVAILPTNSFFVIIDQEAKP